MSQLTEIFSDWLPKLVEPITLGTFVLALYTVRLWRSTQRLALGTERTAERQLRAYVLVQSAQAELPIKGQRLVVRLEFRNFGQTPAYDVTAWNSVTAVESENPPKLPKPPSDMLKGRGPIGPGGDRVFTNYLAQDVRPPMWQRVIDGQAIVYVYGELRYRDIFGKQHFTRFKLRMTGEGAEKGFFAQCEDGNETDDDGVSMS